MSKNPEAKVIAGHTAHGLTSMSTLQLPPLSLYIHIPWCVRKCPYCDFNSHTTENIPEQEYVQALISDLDSELENIQGRSLTSIFFGGGTPSLFSAAAIESILSQTAKRIAFNRDIEITLEANPGTTDSKKFQGYRAAGINRLSIGVQSFQSPQLQALGRIHNGEDAISAIENARAAGFDNFNIDLMHGLPDQSVEAAIADLKRAVDLGAPHLSWYQLTIEPNTAFYSKPPTLPVEDQLADIQDAGEAYLQQQGLAQYEISAYSRQRSSQHNLNYWLFGDYLGIGAGAHGKITHPNQGQIVRRWKTRAPKDYLDNNKPYLAGERPLNHQELPLEFLMNTLRLNQGFNTQLMADRTGQAFSTQLSTLQPFFDDGLLETANDHIRTTAFGRRYLNSILEAF